MSTSYPSFISYHPVTTLSIPVHNNGVILGACSPHVYPFYSFTRHHAVPNPVHTLPLNFLAVRLGVHGEFLVLSLQVLRDAVHLLVHSVARLRHRAQRLQLLAHMLSQREKGVRGQCRNLQLVSE